MDVSAQGRISWSLVVVGTLAASLGACRGESPSSEAAEARRARPVKTTPAEIVAPGLAMLRTSGLWVISSDQKVTAAQLGISKAKGAETYQVKEPGLRIFIFTYESPEVAAEAIQTVVGWINRSGLVHNGEAMADHQRVLVVGTSTPEQPAGDVKKQVNDLMDSFAGDY